jgi:hypothetical protein
VGAVLFCIVKRILYYAPLRQLPIRKKADGKVKVQGKFRVTASQSHSLIYFRTTHVPAAISQEIFF